MSDPGRAKAVRARGGRPCRRFTFLDAMIVIAGVATAIASIRLRVEPGDFDPGFRARSTHDLAGAFLMVSSYLMLVLGSLRPRPPIRRLILRPGAAACFVATVASLYDKVDFDAGQMLAGTSIWWERSASNWIYFATSAPYYKLTCIVPITWLLLAIGRCYRPDAGWIDRSGRLVGSGWIAWAVAGSLL